MLEHGGVCPHRGNVSASCSLFLETSPRHRTEGWASRRAVSGRGSGGGRDDICCVFLLNVSSPGVLRFGKESAYNVGDPGSITGSGRSPGKGNGNPLQCSYLENSTDRGAWWAIVHGVAKSQT